MGSMGLMQLGGLLLALACLVNASPPEVPADLPRLCYTGKNDLASSSLLPCFNGIIDDGNVYGCCLAGDYCLENQACYDKYTEITYQKGCTSSDYDDTNCPRKCDTDQSKADWVGLIYCNGTNGTPKDTWVCQHPDNCFAPASNCPLSGSANWDPGLERTRATHCENIRHDQKWVAFEGKMLIKTTASLPVPSYVSAWWDAHSNFSTRWDSETPHSQTTPYMSTISTDPPLNATPTSSGSSGPTPSSNSTAIFSKGTSSSAGNKIGMAVGLGVGVPLLLAIIGFIIYFLRKHRNGGGVRDPLWPGRNPGDGAVENEKVKGSTSQTYDYPTKAELPTDKGPAQIPEMEGSSVGDHKSPMASSLLPKESGKESVHSPVYELPG